MSRPGLVVGIDLSLTATGVAGFGEDLQEPIVTTIKTRADDGSVFGFATRCGDIAVGIAETFHRAIPDLVIIEGLSYHSKSSSIDKIHASWWMVQAELRAEQEWPAAVKVSPNQRAKYASGAGTASKDSVLIAAVKRYPSLPIRNNNEADAVILAAIGMRLLGAAVDDPMPAKNLEALRGLEI